GLDKAQGAVDGPIPAAPSATARESQMLIFTITAGPECHPIAVLAAANATGATAVATEMLGVEDDEGEPMFLSAREAMDDEAAILESSFATGVDLAECLVLLPSEKETD